MRQRTTTLPPFGWLALLLATVSIGCDSTPAGPVGGPTTEIVNLRVLSSPSPVVIGEGTQPNGIWAQVYAFTPSENRAVALPPGTLEFLLFDGTVRRRDVSENEPHLRLSYTSEQVAPAAATTFAGVRYTLPVRWDEQPPDSGVITLIVRFTPEQGQPAYSSAVSIRLAPT